MMRLMAISLTTTLILYASSGDLAAKGPQYADPKQTDADFAFQGEYTGTLPLSNGDTKIGVQVVAMGDGEFQAVAYMGGLPGDGWDDSTRLSGSGTRKADVVTLAFEQANCTIKNGQMIVNDLDGYEMGKFKRVERRSPTLGKKAPDGAVVLFDGSSVEQWKNGKMTPDHLLMQGTTSKPVFGDHKVHIEFRLPYQPKDRGQQRGNSGIYLQGRYEVQMLDSFGLEGKSNECGGIYTVKAPDVNMCFPPLSWQTYDIEFTAARYDDAGKLLAKPRMTVFHNGFLIHENVELPNDRPTRAAPNKPGPAAGPVFLQNHGCPVRYRNIWVEKK